MEGHRSAQSNIHGWQSKDKGEIIQANEEYLQKTYSQKQDIGASSPCFYATVSQKSWAIRQNIYTVKMERSHSLMQTLASRDRNIVAKTRQIHTDYRVLWRKRDSTATLSRGKCPNPCLDKLSLLFWAHYIEDGLHLLCTGSL